MTREFYDRYWNHSLPPMMFFDNEPEWDEANFKKHERLILPWLVGDRALDLGCGEGRLTSRINKSFLCYGTDISPVALKKARKNFSEVVFIDYLHHTDQQFDNIISTEVMEHIFDFDEYFAVVKMYLKVGGRMIITTNEMCFLKFLAIGLFYKDTFFNPYSPHIRFFTRQTLQDLFHWHGFRIIHFDRLGNRFGFLSLGLVAVAERAI